MADEVKIIRRASDLTPDPLPSAQQDQPKPEVVAPQHGTFDFDQFRWQMSQ